MLSTPNWARHQAASSRTAPAPLGGGPQAAPRRAARGGAEVQNLPRRRTRSAVPTSSAHSKRKIENNICRNTQILDGLDGTNVVFGMLFSVLHFECANESGTCKNENNICAVSTQGLENTQGSQGLGQCSRGPGAGGYSTGIGPRSESPCARARC